MALQKNIVSDISGATLVYHEVKSVNFTNNTVNIMVASYADSQAAATGKAFLEQKLYSFPYYGETLGKPPFVYAEDLLLTLEKFKNASQVP
jgi:hypothetical protein